MHLPDGFISPPVAVVTGLASVAAVAVSLTRCRQAYGIRQAPVLGLTTAFVFAAQMVNFPVAGGTSGHLLGGTLAAVVLKSPWAGTLCITTVLIIQAVLFADGGITALGANALNMAVIGVWVGWGLTQVLHRILGGAKARLPLAAGIAAGISVVAAAIACAIELVLSGTAPANLVLPAMSGIHVLIGIGEGLITGGILTYLQKTQPDLLLKEQPQLEKLVNSSVEHFPNRRRFIAASFCMARWPRKSGRRIRLYSTSGKRTHNSTHTICGLRAPRVGKNRYEHHWYCRQRSFICNGIWNCAISKTEKCISFQLPCGCAYL